jgi:hypothetical protein
MISENYLKNAQKVLFMVNFDLFEIGEKYQKYINCYICKNYTTYKILNLLINNERVNPAKLIYTPFSTYYENQLYDTTIKKDFKLFLHSAGKSSYKNTQTVIETWINHDLPTIIITCFEKCFNRLLNKDISFLKSRNIILISDPLTDESMNNLKNKCGIHICPSLREGYGHYINECRMVKSICITLDTNPYNELIDKNCGFLIPFDKSYVNPSSSFQFSFSFRPEILASKINEILSLNESVLEKMVENAYNRYLHDEELFRQNMKKIRRLI